MRHVFLFQIVTREVGRLRPISDYLFPAAESLLGKAEEAPDKKQFETRVVATRSLWEGVRVRSDNRHVVIEQVFPLAHNYDDAYRALNIWLRETEQKVINLTPVLCNFESLNGQRKNLTVRTLICLSMAWVFSIRLSFLIDFSKNDNKKNKKIEMQCFAN